MIRSPVKTGWKSTEFWFTLLANVASIVTMLADVLPPEIGIPLMTGLNGLYAILRTLIKAPEITTLVEVVEKDTR
jgi:hypothetical protein